MEIASITHTSGNSIRRTISYRDYLFEGDTLDSVTFTPSSTDLTVTGVELEPDALGVHFFVNGGVVNELVTIVVKATTVGGEVINDTIAVSVIAP